VRLATYAATPEWPSQSTAAPDLAPDPDPALPLPRILPWPLPLPLTRILTRIPLPGAGTAYRMASRL
jgi:hypothetical protein